MLIHYEYAVQISTGERHENEDDYNARSDTIAACIHSLLVADEDFVGVAAHKECDWQVMLTDDLELLARLAVIVESDEKVELDKKKIKAAFVKDFKDVYVTKKLTLKRDCKYQTSPMGSVPSESQSNNDSSMQPPGPQ